MGFHTSPISACPCLTDPTHPDSGQHARLAENAAPTRRCARGTGPGTGARPGSPRRFCLISAFVAVPFKPSKDQILGAAKVDREGVFWLVEGRDLKAYTWRELSFCWKGPPPSGHQHLWPRWCYWPATTSRQDLTKTNAEKDLAHHNLQKRRPPPSPPDCVVLLIAPSVSVPATVGDDVARRRCRCRCARASRSRDQTVSWSVQRLRFGYSRNISKHMETWKPWKCKLVRLLCVLFCFAPAISFHESHSDRVSYDGSITYIPC